jgi:DNA polymerase III epsilon subunit-like protein
MNYNHGLINYNGNLLAAIDIETTGLVAGFHEVIQIAIVPLNSSFEPLEDVPAFYETIAPEHPERQSWGALSSHCIDLKTLMLHSPPKEEVVERLEDYFANLPLHVGKNIIPLAHNHAFERSFMLDLLGYAEYDRIFNGLIRDTMNIVSYINDRSNVQGRPYPFVSASLVNLAELFGIKNPNPHDAYNDAMVCARLYKELTRYTID